MLKRSAVLFAGLSLVSSLAGCCCGLGQNRCNPCGGAYYAPSTGGCSPCQPNYGGQPIGASFGADYSGMAAVESMSAPTIAASPTPIYASAAAPTYAGPTVTSGYATPGMAYPTTASVPLQSLPTHY